LFFTAETEQTAIFWDVTQCGLLGGCCTNISQECIATI